MAAPDKAAAAPVVSAVPAADIPEAALPPLHAPAPGLYRHYKGGWYEVLSTVRCSETLQAMVLYRALYGEGLKDNSEGSHGAVLWVRPAAMFSETGCFAGQQQSVAAIQPVKPSPPLDHLVLDKPAITARQSLTWASPHRAF